MSQRALKLPEDSTTDEESEAEYSTSTQYPEVRSTSKYENGDYASTVKQRDILSAIFLFRLGA